MKLIKRVCVKRTIRGYAEVTEIEVYTKWSYGCQVFLVHHVSDTSDTLDDKARNGRWFLNPIDLCEYMTLIQHSFVEDIDVDFTQLAIYSNDSLKKNLMNTLKDGDQWRIIVREGDTSTQARRIRHKFYNIELPSEFGVRIDDQPDACEQAPFLTSLTGNGAKPTIYTSFITADVIAMGFACVGYLTQWAESLRVTHTRPMIVVQRMSDIGWVDTVEYPVVSNIHTMVFNDTLTKTKIEYMG